jgi:uncharacterized protein YndB with AHSA1/START domain
MKSDVNVSGDRLQITRVFDAPRPLVFSWWTRAEKLEQWSGCKEARNCRVVMDFRVGGSFTQTMQIGDICEFSVTGVYDEIKEPERIVYHANFGPIPTRVVVEFFDLGAGTKLVLTHEGLPGESFVENVSRGTSESLDKLDSLVADKVLANQV